jgi:hypothetical protein
MVFLQNLGFREEIIKFLLRQCKEKTTLEIILMYNSFFKRVAVIKNYITGYAGSPLAAG